MADRLCLGFDSSAAHCAAALILNDTVLAARHIDMARGQAEQLMPLLHEVLAEAGKSWRDLDVLGVGTGPGNFTGIRIAVSAARGLALALKIPAIGITATEALAMGLPRPCRVIFPARAGEVIWQDFDAAGPVGQPASCAADLLPDGPAPSQPVQPIAVSIARLALQRSQQPQPRPAPHYLRPADAAPARDRGPVILP
ncbi:tRNA (adenosine(37)-N6)-threonylcarbamoyltransferase complex dimerization subunit type 1 TsaB [Paracoccus sp. (in: a-proteobacteria)]|uniref:tRNA (adenosine(37)-N6)-threonylcarbamoyltransferase complex dimerization subunit type 1 TsaB n=1 Tax=Paracoccus sp. TaxID=267 RepID=UPI0028A15CDB|nr:tRNA (adenosine(37)-N6)-threonylcarbamoyltransferase complex dimerization subunit type 1 TsaB [Paracoccus sp. (in: a-proteobacteria)]